MNIEDRMSMWAAKRPREEPSELLLEGAQEIADLRRHREEDGKQMSALIDGYQKMQALCVDGKYLTDEERKSLTEASDFYIGTRTGVTLRKLLERLYPAGSGYTSGISAAAEPKPTLTDDEREAVEWYGAYGAGDHAATLRALLERMGGER